MMTVPKSKLSSRSFSKRLTAWCLGGIFALAFYGLFAGSPDLANVLAIVGSTSIAHLVLYMGIGHLDFKTLIAQGLLDLRGKGKPDV